MVINNKDFKIYNIAIILSKDVYNYSKNIPKKDLYYKKELYDTSKNIVKNISIYNEIDNVNILEYKDELNSLIGYLDYLIYIVFLKRYINEKNKKILYSNLIQIKKMSERLIKNRITKYDNK